MAKPYNLIGQRFGNLEVISREENNKRGNTQWLCKCDCGNTKIALGYDLTHGRTTSCGCGFNQKGKPSHKRHDLTGRRFGHLTVLSISDKVGKNNNLYWNCICDCGNKYLVSASNLRSGQVWRCRDCIERHSTLVDLTGKRFGRLTVIKRTDNVNGKVAWLCQCDCGNETVAIGNYLKSGHKKSCGCLLENSRKIIGRNLSKQKIQKIKESIGEEYTVEQGFSKTKIYEKYKSMLNRCSPKFHNHKSYYDKGIKVCDEWLGEDGFWVFKEWALSNGYDDSLSLDRVDNDKGYSPDNCRWVTMTQQQNNRSNNIYVTIDNETRTMRQWCDIFNISYGAVKARKRNGWSQERWFEPLHKNQYQ